MTPAKNQSYYQEILDHYLLSSTKNMGLTGDHFKICRERVRQVVTKILGKTELKKVIAIKKKAFAIVYTKYCPTCGKQLTSTHKKGKIYCDEKCRRNAYYATEEERTEGRRLSQNRGTRKWQDKNQEKVKADRAIWYAKNKEKVAQKNYDDYHADIEKSRAISRAKSKKHADKVRLAKQQLI